MASVLPAPGNAPAEINDDSISEISWLYASGVRLYSKRLPCDHIRQLLSRAVMLAAFGDSKRLSTTIGSHPFCIMAGRKLTMAVEELLSVSCKECTVARIDRRPSSRPDAGATLIVLDVCGFASTTRKNSLLVSPSYATRSLSVATTPCGTLTGAFDAKCSGYWAGQECRTTRTMRQELLHPLAPHCEQ